LILAVSDVHLGYGASNGRAFKEFLGSRCRSLGKNDVLVLLGDIFDFWRRNNVAVALENESIFSIFESLDATIHYVVGNHDYTLVDLKAVDRPFEVTKELRLENGGKAFNFIHGYQLEVLANLEPLTIKEYEELCVSLCLRTGDFFGDILSILWDMLHLSFKKGDTRKNAIHSISDVPESRKNMDKVRQLATSRVKDLFLGLGKDEILVFGHIHRPFINGRTANTGCWVSDAATQNTYLEIDNGEMKLLSFNATA
jgi:UDP-2,3-diacylglucosamine pyrophosphatase LpxH